MYIEELKEGDEDGVESGLNLGGGIGLISYILTVKEDMHEHMEDELDDALEALWKIWQREIEMLNSKKGHRELSLYHKPRIMHFAFKAYNSIVLSTLVIEKEIEPRLKTLSQQRLTPKSAPFVQSTILNLIDLGIKVGVYEALAIFEFKQNPKYTSEYVKNRSLSISSGNNFPVNSVFGYTAIVVYDGLMRVTDGNKVPMNFKCSFYFSAGLGLLFMILDCENFFGGLSYRDFTWVSVDVTRMYKNLWHFPVFTYTVELAGCTLTREQPRIESKLRKMYPCQLGDTWHGKQPLLQPQSKLGCPAKIPAYDQMPAVAAIRGVNDPSF
ncbi:hypothetical protein Tco_0070706 [Tanacetum coccineum]